MAAGHQYVEYLAKSEQIKRKLWPISSKVMQTEGETDTCVYNQRRKRTKSVQTGGERTRNKDSKGKWKSGKNFVQFIWPSKITCRCGREITTDAWVCVRERERENRDRERERERERGSACRGIRQHKARSKWATSWGNIFKLALTFFRLCCSWLHAACGMWRVACCALPLVRNCCNWKLAAPCTHAPKKIKDSALLPAADAATSATTTTATVAAAAKLLMHTHTFCFCCCLSIFIFCFSSSLHSGHSCHSFCLFCSLLLLLFWFLLLPLLLKLLCLFHFDFSFSCPHCPALSSYEHAVLAF